MPQASRCVLQQFPDISGNQMVFLILHNKKCMTLDLIVLAKVNR